MFEWLSAPADALSSIVDLIVLGLFIYGAVAVASVAAVIAKGFYALKLLREASKLIKELTHELKRLRDE